MADPQESITDVFANLEDDVADPQESITDVFANLDSKPKAMKVQLLALVNPSASRD